jgi:hypothetical protein
MKNILFVFLFVLNLFFSTTFSFAQDQDVIFAGEENIYLQTNQPQNTTVQRTPAQSVNGNLSGVYEGSRLSCPYAFERDLYVGVNGEDVRLLQVLLNSDSRTMIALDGPGSKGKETNSFGESTKTAVKKFQSLFIEYIGIANGRFGPRTRTTMNAICNGQKTAKSGQVYENVTSVQKDATPAGEVTVIPNDKISPRVSLSANLNSVEPSATFKVMANFSEEVKPISVDSIIVDGGTVKEIRKLSKTSYAITITPNENTKSILVQVEADKISDLAGNLNENASNEVAVKLRSANLAATSTNSLSGLVDKIVSAPKCDYDTQGKLIIINPTTGAPVNANGCPLTKNNTAAFNSQLGCYADSGPLPAGITDVQRCSHPQNPNNPNSPCSSAYQQQWISQQKQIISNTNGYGYGYYAPQLPQNPCQNGQVVAASQAAVQKGVAQNRQAAQQQAQQNAQSSQIGQMLGNLLKSGGLGNMNNRGGNNDGSSGPNVPWTDPDANTKDKAPTPADKKEECTTTLAGTTVCNKPKVATTEPCPESIQSLYNPNWCHSTTDEAPKPETETPSTDKNSAQQEKVDEKAGKVSEDPKLTKKSCPYVLETKEKKFKRTGTVLKIEPVKGQPFVLFQEATGILGNSNIPITGIKNNSPYVEKTGNVVASTYKCCRSNYYTTYCDQPGGPLDDLPTKEISYKLTKKEEISIGSDSK